MRGARSLTLLMYQRCYVVSCFFFQAEDGIRDFHVTGVQTCALPIWAMDFSNSSGPTPQMMAFFNAMHAFKPTELLYSPAGGRQRSEERRVGKECRWGGLA